MGFIPKNAKWYLADIIEENVIDGESENVVHVNIVLIRADSPDEAYQKALQLGHDGEMTYENTDGKMVSVIFRGLRNLNVIHDELEHGAELIYERKVGLTPEEVTALSTPREQLGVFAPITPLLTPNFMPLDIARELEDALNDLDESEDEDQIS
jgi:Domain of unknown function (DUF4288)